RAAGVRARCGRAEQPRARRRFRRAPPGAGGGHRRAPRVAARGLSPPGDGGSPLSRDRPDHRRPGAHGEEPDAVRPGGPARAPRRSGRGVAGGRSGGMTMPGHPQDDRLLELAYGEVEGAEERALRQHVDDCARSGSVMAGIAEVRSAVRRVPPEPAPERGLESLLAYGELAAARARAQRRNVRWLGLLTLATAASLAFVLLPRRSGPEAGPSDLAVRVEVSPSPKQSSRVAPAQPLRFPSAPPPPVQGDRLAEAPSASRAQGAEEPKTKDAERKREAKHDELDALLAKKQAPHPESVRRDVSRMALDDARRAGAVASQPAASPPTDGLSSQSALREEAKKPEVVAEARSRAPAEYRAKASAAPAKVAAATPAPPASSAATPAGATAQQQKSPAPGRSDPDSAAVAGLVGGTVGGLSADKGTGTLGGARPVAKETVASSANAAAEGAAGKAGND